ncbi:aminopeptidase Q [Anolis carolinensis]|uniref:aminopeptidase Q n=1 Tax=Anolis carolinensis TaxID=28377 RepID=UPI002F2B7163
MGAQLRSGCYLGRRTGLFLALLLAALLLALLVLGILLGRCSRAPSEPSREPGPATATPPASDASHAPPARPPGPWDRPRLPPHVAPLHYQLRLWPHLAPGLPHPPRSHSGQVNISARCLRDTDVVLLHGEGLAYHEVSVWEDSGGGGEAPVPVEERWEEPARQYLVLQLRRNLSAGAHCTLRLAFTGKVHGGTPLHGLFLNTYRDQGQNRTLIASQLEPLDARRVYPCFDEPALKATFNISIVHHPSYVALSNMPAIDVSEYKDVNGSTLSSLVNETTTSINWTVTTFATTPKMSTYITAFVVCQYDHVTTTERGNEIRIWASKDSIQKGLADHALNITGPIFSFMEDLFNISYPLSKTDLIALPDMDAGAMENWGLMTFQETSLLYNPKEKDKRSKTRVTQIVSHEIGHQWFGNLVTMEWWNDLWLNEGFATYLEYLGAHHIDSSVSLDEVFSNSVLFPMLQLDTDLEGQSLSVTRKMDKATPIINLFNLVTYLKGASIIRMLSSFVTETLFIKALHSFLNAFSFSNAIQDDLWNHIQKVIDEQNDTHLPAKVKVIMDTWTCQVGYPVLTVNFSTGNISQDRYWSKKDQNSTNNTWIIPISWIRNGTVQPLLWLDKSSKIFPEMKISDAERDWIILNVNVTGYYRINYGQTHFRKLAKVLENDPKVIPVVNKLQLMSDAYSMQWSGYLEYGTALYFTKYLEKEDEIALWNTVLSYLDTHTWDYIRDDYELYPVLKKYFLPRILPIFHHHASLLRGDFEMEPAIYITTNNLEKIFETVCWFGNHDCLNLISEIFTRRMNHPNNEGPICFSTFMCCYGVRMGSDKEWDFLWERQKQNVTEFDEEYHILSSLPCTKEPWLLQRFLQSIINESTIEFFYVRHGIGKVAKNEVGHRIAWKFITDNWEYLYNRSKFGVLRDFMASVNTDVEVQMIQGFLNNTLEPEQSIQATEIVLEAKSAREKKRESLTKMIKWLKKNMDG